MRIACPSCDAAYEVPDRLLAGPPRMLRCSRCGTDFALPRAEAPPPAPEPMPAPPQAEPEAPPPVVPAAPPASLTLPPMRPEAPAALAVPEAEPSQAGLTRAWAVSILVVAAAVIAFLVFHAEVMEAWPASARLFAALGLT